MTVIDVHTHILSSRYMDFVREKGGDEIGISESNGRRSLTSHGEVALGITQGMWDMAERIRAMDQARVDIAILSLTAPNVYWGGPEASLGAARVINDDVAATRRAYPDRIRGLASIPWQYPELALKELGRAVDELGFIGVMVCATIAGEPLVDPRFEPIWREIDRRGLPVLVHPGFVPGIDELDLIKFSLQNVVGFTLDTTLAIGKMIVDRFFDRFTNLKIIASHAGGTLPYLAGRFDRCFERSPYAPKMVDPAPSDYLRRIYYDSVAYRRDALALCIEVGGEDNVIYGTDYPHPIGDMAGILARVNSFDATVAEKIKHRNAERIFKI